MKPSKENQAKSISRRGFLKGVTISTTGALMVAASSYPGVALAAAGDDKKSVDKPASWKTPPEPIPDNKVSKTIEADVVILGAGISGVAAARSAAEAGASVAVVEKLPEDKYVFFGNEIGTVNSRFALDAGVERIDPLEFFDEWQRRMGNRTNPLLVKQYVYNSGAACDWLLELIPDHFKEKLRVYGIPYPKYYTGSINGFKNWGGTILFYEGYAWSDAMKLMVAKAIKLGASFHYETPARQIVKEGKKVAGVIAEDAMGNYVKFVAKKGVLIACGDFSRDKEMVVDLMSEHLDPSRDQLENFRGMGRDGDGQKMGVWAGGRMERGPRAMMNTIDMVSLAGAFGKTAFLRMNGNGERYTNEASWASIAQGFRQPIGSLCAVWDADWRKEMEYQPLDHGSVDPKPIILDRLEKELNALIGTGADGGMVHGTVGGSEEEGGMPSKHYCADTLDELADYLGYKDQAKNNFLATIERYNELVKKGVDEDFAKDPSLMHPIAKPPFFGTVTKNDIPAGAMVTLAGLFIDEYQRVLDDNDDPIPGLFATGNSSGGRYSVDYITPISGNSIGWALTLGRIAGKYIAESG